MFVPRRPLEQVLDLPVRLGPGERGVELDQHQVRDRQPEAPADLAGQQLRDERLPAVARAEQLDDVQPVVVRLDQRGHGSALAQGRHVARRDHGPEHRPSVGPPDRALCGRSPAYRCVVND